MQFPLFFWFELVSLLVAIFYFKKIKSSFLVWLIPFLILTCLTEIAGLYYKYVLHQENGMIYNLYMLLEFPFWTAYYRYLAKSGKQRKVITISGLLALAFAVINLLGIQGPVRFNSYTQIAGALLIICLSAHYFYSLLREAEETTLFKNAFFWISSGVLFYYTGTFLYFALYAYLVEMHSKENNELFGLINLNLLILFYSCIALGLILHRKQQYGNRHYSH